MKRARWVLPALPLLAIAWFLYEDAATDPPLLGPPKRDEASATDRTQAARPAPDPVPPPTAVPAPTIPSSPRAPERVELPAHPHDTGPRPIATAPAAAEPPEDPGESE